MVPRPSPCAASRTFRRTPLLLAVGSLISLAAAAQQAAPEPPKPEAKPGADDKAPVALDRVEITSSKRRQLQSEIAGTVTALSGSKLEQLGAVDAESVFKLSPGVQFNKGNADGALYSIRGIGTNTSSDNVIFGQASTGIYIEDVPFTDPYVYISSPDVMPFDLERVEVLRGPQGALYGSSSLGGAVRYLFAKPDLREQRFTVQAGASSVSGGGTGYNWAAMANQPLVDGVAALRVVLGKRRDPGYVDNGTTGRKDVNVGNADSARVILAVKPMTGLDLTATYVRQKSTQDGDSGVSPDPNRLSVNAPTDAKVDSKFDLGTVQVNWEVAGLRLTSLTGYQTKRRNQDSDLTYQLVPDFTIYGGVNYPNVDRALNTERRSSNSFTQEIRLAPATPGDLNWLVGAFHQKANFFRTQKVTLPGANDPENLPGDIYFETLRRGEAVENSVFADVDWKLTPNWNVGAGARRFKTSVDFERSNFGAPLDYFQDKDSGTTPRFSTRYQFSPQVAAYATASRGYRFGGINTTGSTPYKSDSLWNYEAGLRLQPARNLSLDLSVFTLDWKNIQVSTANPEGFIVIGNVAKARSNGLEATLGWRPRSDLTLNASVAVTDAKLGASFVSANGRDVASGTQLPGVAKFQSTLEAAYRWAGPFDASSTLGAVLQHTGKRKAQLDADLDLPAYTTLDLRWTLTWSQIELAVFAQNVADKRGQSSAVVNYSTYQNPGAVNYTQWYPIRPRTVGLNLRYDY
ncbi:TonB-dependent receptor [Mitsuaria sp. GD03876]|uniref:TonB-dependent receptor n=1 Tax=Mitsuaria sp. GD03876 TaxID=2975399 RepID=UPI002449F7E8|nr:TonB-dependent receptor [Mitsuaria sp. GD03876]MDH0863864.1 TonB-dependent receptor [Mitsuaria sp. GD03876]